jgi:hypothetical protein
MVTEAVYNEWVNSLLKLSLAIKSKDKLRLTNLFNELVVKASSKTPTNVSKLPSKPYYELIGGLKVKPAKYKQKNKTLRRRILPGHRVYRRTTQQRVERGTVQYFLILPSLIFIIFNAFNNPRMPSENARDPVLEFAIFNLFIPLIGLNVIAPPLTEIILFLTNYQTPILIMQSLMNISNWWSDTRDRGLIAASEIVDDLSDLSVIAERADRSWQRMHPASRSPSVESILTTYRREKSMPTLQLQLPVPTYDELVDRTRDYLLKKSLELNHSNKRRVMLLAMTGITRRLALLLTMPEVTRRRFGSNISRNMFSRVKAETVRKLTSMELPVTADYTVCDSCGRTDENDKVDDNDAVTFSRACGSCSYDMCDDCYSKLQRRNPYSISDSNYKKCPRCKNDI